MSDEELIIITSDEAGQRLDKILAARYEGVWSRTYFQKLIDDHDVLVNDSPAKKRLCLQEGDEVQVQFALTDEIALIPENIPLDIVYEDEHLLIINKPAGLVVHPGTGNWSGTFVNALLYHCKNLEQTRDTLRPGIVHRLDKDTSGLLVAAKTALAQQKLVALFAGRAIRKEYLAICVGNPGEGSIETYIGRHPVQRKKMAVLEGKGRWAHTVCHSLAHNGEISFVRLELKTGRTHQIRVHLQYKNSPVLGDTLYGSDSLNKKYKVERQMLHAYLLAFDHPITQQPLLVEAAIPEDMREILVKNKLGKFI